MDTDTFLMEASNEQYAVVGPMYTDEVGNVAQRIANDHDVTVNVYGSDGVKVDNFFSDTNNAS